MTDNWGDFVPLRLKIKVIMLPLDNDGATN